MYFEILSQIENIEIIAVGKSIKEHKRLAKVYGSGRWRKLKGKARIKLQDTIVVAEIHWYEAHGIGRKEFKIKTIIE